MGKKIEGFECLVRKYKTDVDEFTRRKFDPDSPMHQVQQKLMLLVKSYREESVVDE